jgi:hypothetical protein
MFFITGAMIKTMKNLLDDQQYIGFPSKNWEVSWWKKGCQYLGFVF